MPDVSQPATILTHDEEQARLLPTLWVSGGLVARPRPMRGRRGV